MHSSPLAPPVSAMDLPVELAKKLDFSHGRKFRKEILQLFGSSVHHVEASPAGSFFLLVIFRRYTFRLTEESVAFALASCLGGAPAGFHVQFLSDRHFRFSVANKRVGFHVYNIRRFIGAHFDAYFHLWHNGSANWECEKRLWEIEQELQWTTVLSKSGKRIAKSKKRVRFAPEPVRSPKCKPAPKDFVSIGQFRIPISPQPCNLRFGPSVPVLPSSSPTLNFETACMDPEKRAVYPVSRGQRSTSIILNHGFPKFSRPTRAKPQSSLGWPSAPNLSRAWRPKILFTKSKPRLAWRPKVPVQLSKDNTSWEPIDSAQQPPIVESNKKAPDLPHSRRNTTLHNRSIFTPSTVHSSPPQATSSIAAPTTAATCVDSMANYEVNPEPYIPPGFDLEH